MKGFLKSKLVLSLAAFLMIAAAVAIPLLSGSITHSRAAAPSALATKHRHYGKRILLNPNDPVATPPAPTTSRYMKTVDPTTLMNEGKTQAKNGESGVVVLDFGQPIVINAAKNEYGSCIFATNCIKTTAEITAAAEAFIRGFTDLASSGQSLILAIGTSNCDHINKKGECVAGNNNVTFGHGAAWATMVNQVGTWIASQGLSNVQVAGASDMELSWNTPTYTEDWANGYASTFDSSLQFGYFDYGDAAGCPPFGSCNNGWTQAEIVYISWDVRPAYPLPEIYNGSLAKEWYMLSLYSYMHPGSFGRMFIEGAFTEYASDPTTNTPTQGWTQLYNALNADTRTAQNLPYLSDITHHNS